MSEPVTALNNTSDATGIAAISEIGPVGMITLRGDLNASYLRKAAAQIAGVDVPAPLGCNSSDNRGIAWMSPDELLVMCPYAEAGETVEKLEKAIGSNFATAANVSDGRAVFRVSGPLAREVMAKLSPVDLDPAIFKPGMFRRTRLAQVPAAFWMTDDETFQIFCFRSVAQYVFDVLKVAAQSGSAVGHFPLAEGQSANT